MKIEIEVSDANEGTDSPWWMIINPRQNMRTDREASHHISGMITGPFFSREEAELVLNQRRHHYGKGAVVFCASGCYTHQYKAKYRSAEASEARRMRLEEAEQASQVAP